MNKTVYIPIVWWPFCIQKQILDSTSLWHEVKDQTLKQAITERTDLSEKICAFSTYILKSQIFFNIPKFLEKGNSEMGSVKLEFWESVINSKNKQERHMAKNQNWCLILNDLKSGR